MLIREPGVAFRSYDRGVPEGALQRWQIPSAFEPPAGERVPHLVRVETLDA